MALLKTFFVLVYVANGASDYDMTPYIDDSLNSAMTAENCQEAADDLNIAEDGNRYWCIQVYHTERRRKG